jgi:hypothetical protein
MGGYVAHIGKVRIAFKILVCYSMLVVNMQTDLKGIVWMDVDLLLSFLNTLILPYFRITFSYLCMSQCVPKF